jgi:hypothetical protein
MRLFILFISLGLSTIVSAQDWVITTKQDSIYGKINIELAMTAYEEIVIKTDEGKQRLKAYQFIEFSNDGTTYQTVKLDGKYRIMKLEKEGYLSLYRYRQDGAFDFGTQYLLKSGGEGLLIPNLTFKKAIMKYLNDCSKIEQGFENGDYKKSEIHKLIDDYNNCITKNSKITKIEIVDKEIIESRELNLIDAIKSKIDASETELHSLLIDIKTKLREGNAIPGYLKSALKEQTEGMSVIKTEVEELLKSI